MFGLDPVHIVVGDGVVTTERTPEVGPHIRFQRDVVGLVTPLETGTEAARPVVLRVEGHVGNTVVLIIQVDLLVDHLYLRFCNPVFRDANGVTRFSRQGHGIALGVHFYPALGTVVAIQA
ncbi:hypothetical protein D3C75_1145920 [compost metagenome]